MDEELANRNEAVLAERARCAEVARSIARRYAAMHERNPVQLFHDYAFAANEVAAAIEEDE